MGPLNPYARRIVHLVVAEDPEVSSESVGDAFLKTVIISPKSRVIPRFVFFLRHDRRRGDAVRARRHWRCTALGTGSA